MLSNAKSQRLVHWLDVDEQVEFGNLLLFQALTVFPACCIVCSVWMLEWPSVLATQLKEQL